MVARHCGAEWIGNGYDVAPSTSDVPETKAEKAARRKREKAEARAGRMRL